MQPQNVDDLLRLLPAELQNEVRNYLPPADQAAVDVHLADDDEFLPAARQYLADAGDDAFFEWIWSLPENDRQRITVLRDDALRAVFERVTRERLFEGANAAGPSAAERLLARQQAVALFNQISADIAYAVNAFDGTESDDDVAKVVAAYPAFMKEVEVFQNLAVASQEAAAAAVYNTGAAVGPLLARYEEDHTDAGVRAELKAAIERMCAAAAAAQAVADDPDPAPADGGAVHVHLA